MKNELKGGITIKKKEKGHNQVVNRFTSFFRSSAI